MKSLRTRASEDVKEAMQGEEVAVAVQGPTVVVTSRNWTNSTSMFPNDTSSDSRNWTSPVEEEILDEIVALHRKDNHFWGR